MSTFACHRAKQTMDVLVSQTVREVEDIGNVVQSTPQKRKIENRNERMAMPASI